MPTVLDPQLVSTIRRASTIVCHQYPDQLDAEVVLHFHGSDVTSSFSAENGGATYYGVGKELQGLRGVSKLHQYDGSGVRETIVGLLRQGDTLRVWNRYGNHSASTLQVHEGLVLVEQFLIIKRRPNSRGQGKELRFLIDAGVVRVDQCREWGYVAV